MAVLIHYLLHIILLNFSVFSLSSLCVGAVKPHLSHFSGPFVTGNTIFLFFPSLSLLLLHVSHHRLWSVLCFGVLVLRDKQQHRLIKLWKALCQRFWDAISIIGGFESSQQFEIEVLMQNLYYRRKF